MAIASAQRAPRQAGRAAGSSGGRGVWLQAADEWCGFCGEGVSTHWGRFISYLGVMHAPALARFSKAGVV